MNKPMTVRAAMETHAMDLARQVWIEDGRGAPVSRSDDPWFALEAHPQQETLAAAHLLGRGFAPYLPAVTIYAQRGRAWQWRTMPMFRGYLFLRISLAGLETSLDRVRAIPGVRGFVHLSGDDLAGRVALAMIGEADMRRMRKREADSFARKRAAMNQEHQPYDGDLKVGEAVRVTDPRMPAGTVGTIDSIESVDRMKLTIPGILGRATPVTLPTWAVERV